jgi:hypothetical protein
VCGGIHGTDVVTVPSRPPDRRFRSRYRVVEIARNTPHGLEPALLFALTVTW